MRELRRQNEDLKAELQSFKSETNQLLRNMNTNGRKVYQAPEAVVIDEEERFPTQSVGEIRTISLIKCPRTLRFYFNDRINIILRYLISIIPHHYFFPPMKNEPNI